MSSIILVKHPRGHDLNLLSAADIEAKDAKVNPE
jgi:hypothetical protein